MQSMKTLYLQINFFLKFAKDAFCGIIIVELGECYWGLTFPEGVRNEARTPLE